MAINPRIQNKISEYTENKPQEKELIQKLVDFELKGSFSYKDAYVNMVKDTCRKE